MTGTDPSHRSSTGRRLAALAGWLVVVAVAAVLWPASLGGWSSLTVVSGKSMEPTLRTGDIVVGWRTGSYDVGDVIVYEVPDGQPGAGHKVIHRITATGRTYTTQGDNKTSADPWTPTDADVVGRQVLVIPGGAKALAALPYVLAVLAGTLITAAMWPRDDEHDAELEPGRPARPTTVSALAAALVVCAALGALWGASASAVGGLDATAIGAARVPVDELEP